MLGQFCPMQWVKGLKFLYIHHDCRFLETARTLAELEVVKVVRVKVVRVKVVRVKVKVVRVKGVRVKGVRVKVVSVNQSPSIVTHRLINYSVTIPGNCPIAGYRYPEVDQFLGNDTRKLKDRKKYSKNVLVTMFGNC